MKRFWLFLIIFYIHGCAQNSVSTTTRPINHSNEKPEMVWSNEQLYADAAAGKATNEEVDHRFLVDLETCKIQALQIPIPSPACSTIPAPDCSNMDNISKTLCLMQRPYQDCDYSSVNAAYDAQLRVRDSCMKIRGWQLVEVSSAENAPISYTSEYTFIDSILSKEVDEVMEEKIGTDISLLSPSDSIKEKLMRWSRVVLLEEYKNASPQEQLKMRDEYFQKALASKYKKEHLEMMRADFEIFSAKMEAAAK